MLQHKQLAGALTFDPIQWLDIPPKDLQIFRSLFGKPRQMYVMGMRALSIAENSELEFKDSTGEQFVMIFKRGSLVAFGDGNLYFKDEDVLSVNPDI